MEQPKYVQSCGRGRRKPSSPTRRWVILHGLLVAAFIITIVLILAYPGLSQ
jgi:hypothetical protein